MEVDPTRVCELLVGLGDVEVLGVEDEAGGPLRVHVRRRAPRPDCVGCGGRLWSDGERLVALVDLPVFGRPVRLVWHKRRWRCCGRGCEVGTVTEQDPAIALAHGAPIAFQAAQHSEQLTVGFVAESSVVRYPLADRAILLPAVGSETRVCYVEIDPRLFNDYRSGGVASLDTLTEGTPIVTALANVAKGETPSERYATRLSRFAGFAAGIAVAAIFAVDLQTRRKEIGVYRATGTTRPRAFLIFYGDQLLTLVVGCVIAAFATSALLATSDLGRQAALHGLGAISTAVAIAGIGLVPIVAAAICRRDIISTLKQ